MDAAGRRTAGEHLNSARRGIFFGYAMPAADFAFKYLLKRVQPSEKNRPRITVITGGQDAAATIARFAKFLGAWSGSAHVCRTASMQKRFATCGRSLC